MSEKVKYALIACRDQPGGESCRRAKAADWEMMDSCDTLEQATAWCREWTVDSGYCCYVAAQCYDSYNLHTAYAVGIMEPGLLSHLAKWGEDNAMMASVKEFIAFIMVKEGME